MNNKKSKQLFWVLKNANDNNNHNNNFFPKLNSMKKHKNDLLEQFVLFGNKQETK